jgi:hypothetical protein
MGAMRNTFQSLVYKSEFKRFAWETYSLEMRGRIKMPLQEIALEHVDLIRLAQDMVNV